MTRTFVRPTRPARDARLEREAARAAETQDNLKRADGNAAKLLSASLAAAALVAANPVIRDEAVAGHLARAGLALMVGAVIVLVTVVRPKLRGAPFMAADERPETPRERHEHLAPIARRKFRGVRWSVDLLVVAVALVGASVLLPGVVA